MTLLNCLRVLAVALVLTTLSFAAGIAGDLSMERATTGQSVVMRIPPELPADSPRAGPIQPVVRTAAAEARPLLAGAPAALSVDNAVAPMEKPHSAHAAAQTKVEPKVDPDRAPKEDASVDPRKGDAPQAG